MAFKVLHYWKLVVIDLSPMLKSLTPLFLAFEPVERSQVVVLGTVFQVPDRHPVPVGFDAGKVAVLGVLDGGVCEVAQGATKFGLSSGVDVDVVDSVVVGMEIGFKGRHGLPPFSTSRDDCLDKKKSSSSSFVFTVFTMLRNSLAAGSW